VRDVVLVTHEQLQGVRARLERNLGLALPGAEVKVVEVVGNRLVERRQLRVDEQMVMTRVLAVRGKARPNRD
jgi:hypothetical protein